MPVDKSESSMSVRWLAALVIAVLDGASMGIGFLAHGELNACYCGLMTPNAVINHGVGGVRAGRLP